MAGTRDLSIQFFSVFLFSSLPSFIGVLARTIDRVSTKNLRRIQSILFVRNLSAVYVGFGALSDFVLYLAISGKEEPR